MRIWEGLITTFKYCLRLSPALCVPWSLQVESLARVLRTPCLSPAGAQLPSCVPELTSVLLVHLSPGFPGGLAAPCAALSCFLLCPRVGFVFMPLSLQRGFQRSRREPSARSFVFCLCIDFFCKVEEDLVLFFPCVWNALLIYLNQFLVEGYISILLKL